MALPLLGVLACRRPLDARTMIRAPEGRSMADAAPGPEVTVSADRRDVPNGATLRITVTVKNVGTAAQSLSFTSGCQTDYELVDAAGAVAASSDQMCAQALGSRSLSPGEAFSDVHVLIRGARGMAAPPGGAYTLRGVVLLAGGPRRSAPIAITLP